MSQLYRRFPLRLASSNRYARVVVHAVIVMILNMSGFVGSFSFSTFAGFALAFAISHYLACFLELLSIVFHSLSCFDVLLAFSALTHVKGFRFFCLARFVSVLPCSVFWSIGCLLSSVVASALRVLSAETRLTDYRWHKLSFSNSSETVISPQPLHFISLHFTSFRFTSASASLDLY